MSKALVVQEDTAYTNGVYDITQTPEGRLRVDVGSSGSYGNAVARTSGTPFVATEALGINATTAGTVTLVLVGGASVTINVPLGFTVLPFTATTVTFGTAAGTIYSLS
jgi:hypothetical protein